jgi:hypothetical protein
LRCSPSTSLPFARPSRIEKETNLPPREDEEVSASRIVFPLGRAMFSEIIEVAVIRRRMRKSCFMPASANLTARDLAACSGTGMSLPGFAIDFQFAFQLSRVLFHVMHSTVSRMNQNPAFKIKQARSTKHESTTNNE